MPVVNRIAEFHADMQAWRREIHANPETAFEEVLTAEWVDWADLILVMEKRHQKLLNERFGRRLKGRQVVCLRIPDQYEFMEPALVELLQERAGPYLP